eukprot:TRINITY_DN91366_c0_g1_i1.p1 TRINITY_DN91366_c0_g1~~TRINITY_DN91366_c0_g1_i1.p1  ORF type:complete len:315 (-),score=54.40 TRINITY_DN91366_c0_g1_i1:90-1034(-)
MLRSWFYFGCLATVGVADFWYPERDLPKERFEDDITYAINTLKKRVKEHKKDFKQSYGIVVFADETTDKSFSDYTVPLWQEYAKRHKQGFFAQTESLVANMPWKWTITRTLMELLPAVKWKWTMVLTANTIPRGFDTHWSFLVKDHIRQKRYSNDDVDQKAVWSPNDCESDDDEYLDKGTCYGPFLDLQIWASKKKKLVINITKSWHVKRLKEYDEDDKFKKAYEDTRTHFYNNMMHHSRCQSQVGRSHSKFIPFWPIEIGISIADVREQIHDAIKNHPILANLSNKLFLEEEAKTTNLLEKENAKLRQQKGEL